MHKNFLFVGYLLFISSTNLLAQYVSHVVYPDTATKNISLQYDKPNRYASGISPSTLRDHLRIIASDSMEGRETGTQGIEKAAQYIERHIKNIGLLPNPQTKEYFQNVAFTYSKWKEINLSIDNNDFRMMWDYIALTETNKSMPAFEASEVIFMGYGIDDVLYSDYNKINVQGKVIMINKGEPVRNDNISCITQSAKRSIWSEDINKKLIVAKDKGAKLVLIIEDDIKKVLEANRRSILGGGMTLGKNDDTSIPTCNHLYISSAVAKAIIGSNEDKIIKARKKINNGKPEYVKLKVSLKLDMEKETNIIEGKNIIGYIKGKTKPDEYIIVSAHYDHIGKKGEEVFNGANDNGSGTVTLMEIARAVQQAVLEDNVPDRSIVFLWVCGEEKGLLGSKYYSENPVFDLSKTVANINVDMVGRMDKKYQGNPNYIYVIGSDRLSTDLHKINEAVNQKYTRLILDYTYNDQNDPNRYYYRSDHYNFAKKGIPAIFYFNGTHEDYHRTTDDIEKINFDTMAQVDRLIFHTMWELANRKDRIVVDGEIK